MKLTSNVKIEGVDPSKYKGKGMSKLINYNDILSFKILSGV